MQHDVLAPELQARLKQLPEPDAAQCGVVPPPPPPQLTLDESSHECSAAVAALAVLDEINGATPHFFFATRLLMRQEAVASSSMAGTPSTLDELLTVEEHSTAPARPAVRQVRSYSLALEQALAKVQAGGREALTIELICSLHRDLLAQAPSYRDFPGDFRLQAVRTAAYNPPPPDDVPACMQDHVTFLRGQRDLRGEAMPQLLPLPARMAVAHAHFAAVHPFGAGNGRVGRLLLPLMMAAEDHPPLFLAPYIAAHLDAYQEALQAAQLRLHWDPIVRLIAQAIVASLSEWRATCRGLTALPHRWRSRDRFRTDSAALRTLEVLPSWPILTVKRLSDLLEVSYQAANVAVERLVHLGILTERTGYQKHRLFAAPDVLTLLNRPFGHALVLP